MKGKALASVLVATAFLAACSQDSGSPTATMPFEPQFARPGSGPTDPSARFLFPLGDAGRNLRSDHIATYDQGDYSAYANGTCGVHSKIFATTEASSSGDAIMDTGNPKFADKKCRDYPRKVTLVHPDGSTESFKVFINVRNIHNTTSVIPIGQRALRLLAVNGAACGWRWGASGTDMVWVERIDARTWHVYTQDLGPTPEPGKNRAACVDSGNVENLTVDVVVVADRDLATE